MTNKQITKHYTFTNKKRTLCNVQYKITIIMCLSWCIFPHRFENGGIAFSMSNSPV